MEAEDYRYGAKVRVGEFVGTLGGCGSGPQNDEWFIESDSIYLAGRWVHHTLIELVDASTSRPKIDGYKPLTAAQVELVNRGKQLALRVKAYTEEVKASDGHDARWLSIGVTDLQKGFQSTFRSVLKPDGF